MRIGIEAQRIFRTNKHGMDYVVLEEVKRLQGMDTENEYFVFVKPGPDHCLESTANFHIIELKCPSYPLWEQWALPKAAKAANLDLLHCTSNTAPIGCHIPLVLTLHDIIFLEPRDNKNKSIYQNLGWYYRRFVVPRIIGHCKRIITVSKFEYERIASRLNLPDGVLTFIYNGYNERFRPIADYSQVCKKYIDAEDYFFYFGNTDPKKNTLRTMMAYAMYLSQSKKKKKLLLADMRQEDIDALLSANGLSAIRNMIVVPGYIDNRELPYIYNGAFAFLYTSLRESFGIPLLEAMACGTPVITSNTSSMPEISGERAIMVNPESEQAIANKMIELEENSTVYNYQKSYGLERVKHFSWNDTAANLLKLYQQVGGEK